MEQNSSENEMSETTRPKPFVFVLMPFSPEFDDTYRLAIKPACDKAGAYSERVDDQIFDGNILQRIFNQIAKADIIISVLTGKNPNVFYETGYAHALGKRTLLLTSSAEDITFDFKHFPHIIYGGRLSDLLPELERKLRWHIENPEKRETTPGDLIVRVNSRTLTKDSNVVFGLEGEWGGFELHIEVHNSAEREIRTLEYQIGVISPLGFYRSFNPKTEARLDDFTISPNERLHLSNDVFRLLPARWGAIDLALEVPGILKPREYPFIIRIFTESGYSDFPFTFKVSKEHKQKK